MSSFIEAKLHFDHWSLGEITHFPYSPGDNVCGQTSMFVSLFVLDPQSEFYFAEKKERVAMKKPYQIESQRAVKRLEKMAAEGNPAVQMGSADGRDGGLAAARNISALRWMYSSEQSEPT